MIIDAHTHLFSDAVRKNPGAFCRRDEAFRLLYGNKKARLAGVDDLLESMNREGIDRSVICGFPWTDPELCREGNDYLLSCFTLYPRRVIPFACIPVRSPRRAEAEAERCLSSGIGGIGELAFYRGDMTDSDVRRLARLGELLAGTGCPLLLHVNEPVGHDYPGKGMKALQPVYLLLQKIPRVDVILAHWGGGFFFYELMPEVARAARRVYYDTAASPFLYLPGIYSLALRIVGPGRILLGSDFPLLPPSKYIREMSGAGLSSRVREKIQGGNARRLFSRHIKTGFTRKDRVQ